MAKNNINGIYIITEEEAVCMCYVSTFAAAVCLTRVRNSIVSDTYGMLYGDIGVWMTNFDRIRYENNRRQDGMLTTRVAQICFLNVEAKNIYKIQN